MWTSDRFLSSTMAGSTKNATFVIVYVQTSHHLSAGITCVLFVLYQQLDCACKAVTITKANIKYKQQAMGLDSRACSHPSLPKAGAIVSVQHWAVSAACLCAAAGALVL